VEFQRMLLRKNALPVVGANVATKVRTVMALVEKLATRNSTLLVADPVLTLPGTRRSLGWKETLLIPKGIFVNW
jgi:hypothetical protein